VGLAYGWLPIEIGDCAGDPQDAVIAPSGQFEAFGCL
jgi:hypothetical protein